MTQPKKLAQVGSQCVACGACTKSCPLRAIAVHKGLRAIVDREKCVGCGKCVSTCPAGVIDIIEVTI